MNDTCPICGHLVGDAEVAIAWHQRQGDPQDIPLSGHNDVPPLPPKDES